ncbi:MAG: beta-lactamase family protein [Lachnospiraceae bacterium]|nr:beta-lactamase family protein [Lachnospiraceae bacterium]
MKRSFIALLALIIGMTYTAADDSGIRKMVRDFESRTGCGSVSVVIVDHGDVSYYGDPDGLYQIGSMTKAFTGLAVRELIDEGVISEDDCLSELIPGFEAYYKGEAVEITVEDLLRQESGYTNSESAYPSAAEGMTLAQWAESINRRELVCMPGDEYNYSNVNYNLLGLIIENVTGMSYREYMEENILSPAGLDSTYVGTPDDPSWIIKGSRIGFRIPFAYEVPVREGSIPAGYFYSDTEDIGSWLIKWIYGEDEAVTEILSHLEKEGDYYAGWEMFEDGIIGHSGGTANYSSRIVFSRDKEIGVCVLTNLNVAASTDSLCNNICSYMLGENPGSPATDVWTVFDIIFSVVTLIALILFVLAFIMRRKRVLISTGLITLLLLALTTILMPAIFGASLHEIISVWAPLSFGAGIAALALASLALLIKFFKVLKNEGRKKTG